MVRLSRLIDVVGSFVGFGILAYRRDLTKHPDLAGFNLVLLSSTGELSKPIQLYLNPRLPPPTRRTYVIPQIAPRSEIHRPGNMVGSRYDAATFGAPCRGCRRLDNSSETSQLKFVSLDSPSRSSPFFSLMKLLESC